MSHETHTTLAVENHFKKETPSEKKFDVLNCIISHTTKAICFTTKALVYGIGIPTFTAATAWGVYVSVDWEDFMQKKHETSSVTFAIPPTTASNNTKSVTWSDFKESFASLGRAIAEGNIKFPKTTGEEKPSTPTERPILVAKIPEKIAKEVGCDVEIIIASQGISKDCGKNYKKAEEIKGPLRFNIAKTPEEKSPTEIASIGD